MHIKDNKILFQFTQHTVYHNSSISNLDINLRAIYTKAHKPTDYYPPKKKKKKKKKHKNIFFKLFFTIGIQTRLIQKLAFIFMSLNFKCQIRVTDNTLISNLDSLSAS